MRKVNQHFGLTRSAMTKAAFSKDDFNIFFGVVQIIAKVQIRDAKMSSGHLSSKI